MKRINKTRLFVTIGVLAVIAILIPVFALQRESDNVIKIGVAAPLTGGVSYQGERFVQGASIALEEYNSKHDIKIDLVVEDDKCSSSDAVPVANKFVNIDGIDKVVSYCGASSVPYITQIRDKGGIVFVSSVRMEISEGKDPFVLNLLPPPAEEMGLLASYIKNKGIDKVAVIYQQDFFGETYKNKFTQEYEKLGGEVVLLEGYDKNAAKDFKTSLTKIRNSDSQGIINFMAHAGTYDILLKEAEENGVDLPFFSQWITENPTLIDVAGERSDGITYTHPFKELDTPEFREFEAKYVVKYGEKVNLDSVNGYDVVMLYGQLIEECGDDSVCMVQKLNSGSVYTGILSDMKFKDYMKDGEFYLKTISDGAFVSLE